MNFDDLKDRLQSELKQLWEKIQDSSAYNQARDRFENLSPFGQKASLIGAVFLVLAFFFSIPWGFYSNSSLHEEEFLASRNLIKDLFKAQREAQEAPQLMMAPSPDSLKMQIENSLKAFQLLPDQIKGVEVSSEKTSLLAENLVQGFVKVSLAKLNLRQINDIGYQLQSLNPNVKIKDLSIEPSLSQPKYFDASFRLVALKIPEPPPLAEILPEAEAQDPAQKKPSRPRGGNQ